MIEFEKWHGLGNDFVVVRAAALGGRTPDAVSWCDRRRGIGADGVLVVHDEGSDGPSMVVHNADGSIPEICGNGIRCVVGSWAREHSLAAGEVRIGTGAGVKRCRFDELGVSVDMGVARVAESTPKVELPDADWVLPGDPETAYAVSVGNPHLVLFGRWPAPIDATAARRLEHHPDFPERANVSFVRRVEASREGRGDGLALDVTVWERGVGFTQACGTAACATAAAAVANQWAKAGDEVTVRLPGGALGIVVEPDGEVTMRGPAQHVFDGRWER